MLRFASYQLLIVLWFCIQVSASCSQLGELQDSQTNQETRIRSFYVIGHVTQHNLYLNSVFLRNLFFPQFRIVFKRHSKPALQVLVFALVTPFIVPIEDYLDVVYIEEYKHLIRSVYKYTGLFFAYSYPKCSQGT